MTVMASAFIKDAALTRRPSGSFVALVDFMSWFEITSQEGKGSFQKHTLGDHVGVGDGYGS